MEWLDRCYEAFSKYHHETQAARKGAESAYDNLWTQIAEAVRAANEKGMQLTTDGFPHSRVIAMSLGREVKRELKLTLDRENLLISAESDAAVLTLQIGVDDTQVVCLCCDRKILPPERAAQKIMESFLFGGKSPYAVPESLGAQAQQAMRNWGEAQKKDPRLQVPY